MLFELYACLCPEEVKIDPFELFKSQGSLLFNLFCIPDGRAFSHMKLVLKHLLLLDGDEYAFPRTVNEQIICEAWNKLKIPMGAIFAQKSPK